eukprot:2924343-Ditylum_brightwellii.AAC.2
MSCHSSSTPCLPIPTTCVLPCLCDNSRSIMLPTPISRRGELIINKVVVPNANINNSSNSNSPTAT